MVYIVGPPGVGKYTIGRLLAEQLGCRLVDNHYWCNVIFSLVKEDGITPLPKGIWPLVGQVRSAVLKTIGEFSPVGRKNLIEDIMRLADKRDGGLRAQVLR